MRFFFLIDVEEVFDELWERTGLEAPYSDDGEAQDMEGYESGGEGGRDGAPGAQGRDAPTPPSNPGGDEPAQAQ